jgi:hypothetical protein
MRQGERIHVPLPKQNPETGQPLTLQPCPFSNLLFGEECDLRSDQPGSVLLAGTQYVVKPGDGAILVLMLARRRADFTHQAFRERWLNGHAPFGLQTAVSGYRQLHPREEPTPDGFDGAGLVFFRNLDHVANARAAPEIARAATRDEMQFIDHSRSMLAMFHFD